MKISVFVKPNSKKGDLIQATDDGITVFLRAKAVDNAANNSLVALLVALLAKNYSVPKTCIRIISGHNSRHKIVEILTV